MFNYYDKVKMYAKCKSQDYLCVRSISTSLEIEPRSIESRCDDLARDSTEIRPLILMRSPILGHERQPQTATNNPREQGFRPTLYFRLLRGAGGGALTKRKEKRGKGEKKKDLLYGRRW